MVSVQLAMKTLGEAIKNDPDYRRGWHSNLSMMMQDEGVDRRNADERADDFLRVAFNA